MSWFLFAFASALLTSIAALLHKKALVKEHAMEFSATLAVFNVLFSLPFLFSIDFQNLTFLTLLITFGIGFLASIAFVLVAKSVRHMDVSHVSPLLVLRVGVVALLATIFLDEYLTFQQVGGIVFLMIGTYILETKKGAGFFEPLHAFVRSKYIHFVGIAILLYGTTAVGDRVLLARLGMQPEAFLFFVNLFIGFHMVAMLATFHDGRDIVHCVRKAGGWVLLIAILTVAYRYTYILAVKDAFVGLANGIKQTSAFFTTIIGGELFREKDVLRRSIACFVLVIGAVLLVL